MPPNPFQDGTSGILLSFSDIVNWSNGLVFQFIVVQPPNILIGEGLPREQQNLLSIILLPV